VHYWFAAYDPAQPRWIRWEVWQDADAGGVAHGHVHRDLMDIDAGVGGGPARIAREWRGEPARRLIELLWRAHEYPDRDHYHAWPGPNSNTFARWALDRARIRCPLDARAIGKDHRGTLGLRLAPAEPGIALESVLGGAAIGAAGFELHLLGFTLGLSWWPLTLKTPLGDLPARAPAVTAPTPR
jgi:hypothetical protein